MPGDFAANPLTRRSAIRLLFPSSLVGAAALSVEMLTNVSTPTARAASRTLRVPWTFVFHAYSGNRCSIGRCLSAAAWNTICGFASAKI